MAATQCIRERGRITACFAVLLLFIGAQTIPRHSPAEPPPDKQPNPAVNDHQKEVDQLAKEAIASRDAGKLPEAIAAVQKVLAIQREVVGNDHQDVLNTLAFLADIFEQQADFASALRAREQVLAMREKLSGNGNWQTTDMRLMLEKTQAIEKLDAAQRKQLVEANDLQKKSMKLYRSGKYQDAIPIITQALDIKRAMLGEKHPEYADLLQMLSRPHRSLRNSDTAESLLQQVLKIRRETVGEKHPDYAECLHLLATIYEDKADYAKALPLQQQALRIRKETVGEKDAFYAQSLDALAGLYKSMGDYAKAEPLLKESTAIYKEQYGERHEFYADCLQNLGRLYTQLAEFAKAEPLLMQALQIHRNTLGEKHPTYAVNLADLAYFYNQIGEHGKAEDFYLQALRIEKAVLGEKHPRYGIRLHNLAHTYALNGEFAKAEPLFLQSLQIDKDRLGEKHPSYATGLGSLALTYLNMGDSAKAEPLLRQALQLRKESLGEKHPEYARSLNNLAAFCGQIKDYAAAEAYNRQATRIFQDTLGEKHPEYAQCLHNLGTLFIQQKDFLQAEANYQRAVEVYKVALGERHPRYALCLSSLAYARIMTGKYEQTEPLLRQALEITNVTLGKQNQERLIVLKNLAILYQCTGEYAQAEPLIVEAMQIARQQLDRTASIQSERQQLAMRQNVWTYLDAYLDLTGRSSVSAEQAYQQVLGWKGVVGARQQQIRHARRAVKPADEAKALELEAALAAAMRSLSTLSRNSSGPAAEKKDQLAALGEKIEGLQKELSLISQEFQQQLQQQRRTPDEIRRVLPADSLLVDLLSCDYFTPAQEKGQGATWQSHLIAFVVRPGQPVERVELGPAEPIKMAIEAWRRQFGVPTSQSDPGAELRKLLWQPLEKFAQDAKIVLISPNALTAPLPWSALPGKTPGTYLINDLAVTLVPIPNLLPELLAGDGPPTADHPQSPPSLLVVGDVDFDAEPGQPEKAPAATIQLAARGGQPQNWKPLPGTRAEVAAIKDSFHKRFGDAALRELSGGQATHGAVRGEAPNYQFLHFATHGFFAPPQLRSALASGAGASRAAAGELSRQDLAGFHPGLLSGLVLAGANQPPQDGREDGILTALEVSALDLSHVQLATLSACETGLGETAGGEGLLGLQRAFQTAGAKTVLAGLWKVPDRATQALMARFYNNLWEKKMSQLDALCEAQRWMIREGAKLPDLVRGLDVLPDAAPRQATDVLPPYYWAAFVLSGDWR